jgi:hypothetical protein
VLPSSFSSPAPCGRDDCVHRAWNVCGLMDRARQITTRNDVRVPHSYATVTARMGGMKTLPGRAPHSYAVNAYRLGKQITHNCWEVDAASAPTASGRSGHRHGVPSCCTSLRLNPCQSHADAGLRELSDYPCPYYQVNAQIPRTGKPVYLPWGGAIPQVAHPLRSYRQRGALVAPRISVPITILPNAQPRSHR